MNSRKRNKGEIMKRIRNAAFLSILIAVMLAGVAHATILWSNNAASVLASDITAGTLSLTVTSGHGDRFPVAVSPHYFMATLVDTSGNREIVKVTARASASNTMTITRAQEGTSARSFAAGSIVELRITKNALDAFSKSADIHYNHFVCDASAADQGATTNANSLKSIVDSLGTKEATIDLPRTGTGDTTTYTLGTSLTIPVTVTLRIHKGARISASGGQTLTMNGIVQAGAYQVFAGAGTVTVSTYPQDQAWWGLTQRFDTTFNGYSGDAAAMRATADPYPASVESLATTLQGEIQRIRYILQQITGKTYWYQDPATNLGAVTSFPSGTKIFFYQDTCPSGWTYVAVSDAVIAVKGGANAYNVAGGNSAGTWTQPNHTHAPGTLAGPSHTHELPIGVKDGVTNYLGYISTQVSAGSFTDPSYFTIGTAATDNSAIHPFISNAAGTGAVTGATDNGATANTWRPTAIVGIICSKD
jgi:hypothetical protein